MSDYANMSRFFGTKGYVAVGTTPIAASFYYGLTVTASAVITSITAPTSQGHENTSYNGDEPGLAGATLAPGFYPIRFSTIDLASGSAIAWIE